MNQLISWFGDAANWHGSNGIPTRLAEHLMYSGVALLVAMAIALPIGLLTGHTGRGGFLAINSGNTARALPTVGLLTLVVTLAGIGYLPVLVALVAVAVPPLLVNTYVGMREVDPDVRDAARGVGMTRWQLLTQVEIPVALPLILLGIRTAAVQTISTATIAAYVALGGLGRYIFDGLSLRQYGPVIGGAVLVAGLAIATEFVFFLLFRLVVSRGLRQQSPAR